MERRMALFFKMKRSKKIVCLVSVFILTLFSCSNDDNSSIKLLQKMVETSEGGLPETTFFTYNGSEIVSMDGANKRTDFTYTAGLITKTVAFNKMNQSRETTEYSYLKDKIVEVASVGKYRISYVHNLDKTVSYQKITFASGNQEVKEFHGTLYFENENLIKDERIADNTATGVTSIYSISFDYDANKNPLFHIKGLRELLDHNEKISINNSLINIETTSLTKDDQIISAAALYKSIFKYDLDKYPTERVSENAILSNGNRGYLKTEYFY